MPKASKEKVAEKPKPNPWPQPSAAFAVEESGSSDYARFYGSRRTSVLPVHTSSAGNQSSITQRPDQEVQRVRNVNRDAFERIRARGEPVVLEGVDWGRCVEEWTPQ